MHDDNRIEVNVGVGGDLGKRTQHLERRSVSRLYWQLRSTHVTHVSTRITVETMNNDNSTLNLGRIDTLAIGSQRLVVNESEVVVYSAGSLTQK